MSDPRTMGHMSASWFSSISDVDQASWDNLAVRTRTPFLEWRWLKLLEITECVSAECGWQPYHLALHKGGDLVAAAPLYVKTNSRGEFVFDQIWAEVAARLGVRYYPKLLGMSPFTPTGAYEFLIEQGMDRFGVVKRLVREIDHLCLAHELSGSHFLFADASWALEMRELGYQSWIHQGYAWKNDGYVDFDDFLQRFKASQRKNIRRERRSLHEEGIHVRTLQGDEITPKHLDIMYLLYSRHNEQFGPWSCKFLNRAFFQGLGEYFRDRLLLVVAVHEGRPDDVVGMALLVVQGKHLFGRYWGCFEEIRFLHFEVCYYTPIEWAIRHKVERFDPGVGGFHKTRRGFQAVPSYSLHRFHDPRLKMVMETHMDEINALEQGHIDELNEMLPLTYIS